jgi:hypothetical protein
MNVESFMQLLKKNNAESCYNVAIPSIGKNVRFKSMTVSQKKSIAKAVIDAEAPSDAHGIKIALIKELISEDVDLNKFNIVDMIAVLCQISMNNMIDYPEMKFTCNKCKNDVTFRIDYDAITKNCVDFKFNTIVKEYEFKNIKYKFTLSEPLMNDVLMFLTIKGLISKTYDLQNKVQNNLYAEEVLPYYAMTCVNAIEIDGQAIEDASFKNKIEMLNYIPADIMYNVNNGLIRVSALDFAPGRYDKVFNTIVCPVCDDKKEGLLTIENFFII